MRTVYIYKVPTTSPISILYTSQSTEVWFVPDDFFARAGCVRLLHTIIYTYTIIKNIYTISTDTYTYIIISNSTNINTSNTKIINSIASTISYYITVTFTYLYLHDHFFNLGHYLLYILDIVT